MLSRPVRPGRAAGLAVAGLAGALLLRQLDPNTPGGVLPPCPFFVITGIYCPGCGTTRALHALAHFDVAAALAMNPLLVLCMPLLVWLLADMAGWRPAALVTLRTRVVDARPWAVVVIAYAVMRNLPWAPFTWLAPGGVG
ncbi:DUF2752 domain-containing protein [Arenimonas composti]|uniref:DUF2752 domain-containing protein n=1 Tax=Arenimonas composti TR7-09 = DSM 18010 TaxID=1121013 RepID=A0A091BXY0_9GAMM|nr:DUF2752 domain-containing protein [Arenimonas composti]KFN49210.1 hypothetical protein P873_12200 [Arenimonas composti TR7-09 = DSM 18010]